MSVEVSKEGSQSIAPETQSSQATPASVPQGSADAPQSQAGSQGQHPAAEQSQAAPQAPVPPAFQPTFKFKVHDQEHEIPELYRPLIKDQASEKQVREIFEKAFGLDVVKPKLERTRTELTTEKQQHHQLRSRVNKLGMYLEHQDLDSFFGDLKIPDELVFNWAHQKLLEKENPQLRAQRMYQQKILRDNYDLTLQNQELSQGALSASEQAVQLDLQTTLSQPEIATVASSFDKRVGRPGAFAHEVAKRAAFIEYQTGKTIPASEAVAEVMALMGPFLQAGSPEPQGAQAAPQAQPGVAQTKPTPPVIPHVGGKNTSPTKKVPKSLDDLKKMADEMAG